MVPQAQKSDLEACFLVVKTEASAYAYVELL